MPERIQDILRRYQGKGQWDIYISAPEINRLIVLDEKREAEIARLRKVYEAAAWATNGWSVQDSCRPSATRGTTERGKVEK